MTYIRAMMAKAVITGDIVQSTGLSRSDIGNIMVHIEDEFTCSTISDDIIAYDFFQGDSFQLLHAQGHRALYMAMRIKTAVNRIKSSGHAKRGSSVHHELKLAISIGQTDVTDEIARSNEEIFIRSGRGLEQLKSNKVTLGLYTAHESLNQEMNTTLFLWHWIMDQWTLAGAEVMYWKLKGKTEREIAERLDISQSAVNQRAASAGYHAWELLDNRFRQIVSQYYE